MNSEQLADKVVEYCGEAVGGFTVAEQRVVDTAVERILGVGDQQYSEGEKQKFELVPMDKLLEMFQEETVDQVNYAVMFLNRLRESPDVDLSDYSGDRDWIDDECLDLIESALDATTRIQTMRDILSNAQTN